MPPRTTKQDQRARLLQAMIEISAKDGYPQASIAQAVARAQVSRSTYYEHFEDKQACFVAAHHELCERLLADVRDAVRDAARTEAGATDAALGAIMSFAEQDAPAAQTLMNEALAAGGHARDRRDLLVSQLAGVLEDAWKDVAQTGRKPTMDISPPALIGGVFRLISIRLLRGPGNLRSVLPDLSRWAGAYTRTQGAPRWRSPEANGARVRPPRSPYADLPDAPPPGPLPPGRRTLSASAVAGNQRERILHAGVTTFAQRGYAATTAADIVAAAHLTRAVFYQHFHSKQELFMEIQQVYFHQMMAISARAYFSASSWPERVWDGILSIADLFSENPHYAHIGAIETSAAGRESLRYTHDAMMAFSVFLQEGYRQSPAAERLPALCSDAIAGALIEIVYLAVRHRRLRRLPEQTPAVVYLALAPFLGPERAGDFVEGKLREI